MPSKAALLIVDMINELSFPEGEALLKHAKPAARNIAKLRERFHRKKWPVIFVNDNYGQWQGDWKAIFQRCSDESSVGHELAELLHPDDRDFFILKPRHSGFHETPLEILLKSLKVRKLVITGIAGNICVMFTAHDAHMRGFEVVVPRDCIASNTQAQNRLAISQLSEALKIKTPLSPHLP